MRNIHHIDRNPANNNENNLITLPSKFHSGIHNYVGFGKDRKPMPSRWLIEKGLDFCIKNKIKLNTHAWLVFMESINHNYIGIHT